MSKTYSAHAEPGQGMTLGARIEIVKGFTPIVKYNGKTVLRGALYRTKAAALEEATRQAARYRAYRTENGEGLEDVQQRKIDAQAAARRRSGRISQKSHTAYELVQALVSDAELVKEWLPAQAVARLDKARELVVFVETDAR